MMNPSLESTEQGDVRTQELPDIPTIQEMDDWGKEKVLEWIKTRKKKLLEGDNLENFNKADVTGSAFLISTLEFFKSCNLTPGASLQLMHLVNEVKERGERSDQTAGKKRKGDERDAPESPHTAKKGRQEDSLEELAVSARDRRARIKQKIIDINHSSDQHSNSDQHSSAVHPLPGAVDNLSGQHSNPVHSFPGAVDKLSDPKFEHKLIFPFVGFKAPVRFQVDNTTNANWSYVGRMKFKELLQELKEVRRSATLTALWLYGTRGYGKSHLLSALVCYLAAEDERVVYVPACQALLKSPLEYMRASMLFAWADDATTQEEIKALVSEGEVERFFNSQKDVIFVIDQMNGVKRNSSAEETAERANLRKWLNRLTSKHTTVYSCSANYRQYMDASSSTQTSDKIKYVYGGLVRAEMDQWWKRHRGIDKGGYKESDVEDITGCIPLLLDECSVGGKIDLNVSALREIFENAAAFVRKVRMKTKSEPDRWNRYCKFVKACICHTNILPGWTADLDLIDHRYFFQLGEHGDYTCGLVRKAVGDQLLLEENFADTDFLPSLPRFIDNPSVTGFMIEYAVLSSIQSKGLAIGARIGKSMDMRPLMDPPEFEKAGTDRPVLYRPQKFNFKAIDGIIIRIEPDKLDDAEETENAEEMENMEETENAEETKNAKRKKKLSMFPLHITVAPDTHADSRQKFFKEYGSWITDLSKFDVEVQFLWITPQGHKGKKHPADPEEKWPEHQERFISLKVVNKEIWETYEDALKKLPKNKPAPKKAAPKTLLQKKLL